MTLRVAVCCCFVVVHNKFNIESFQLLMENGSHNSELRFLSCYNRVSYVLFFWSFYHICMLIQSTERQEVNLDCSASLTLRLFSVILTPQVHFCIFA